MRTDKVGGNPVSVTETLSYNGLGQLATMEWTESGYDWRNRYEYDANGNLTKKTKEYDEGGWITDVWWGYSWDVQEPLKDEPKAA